MSQFIEGLGGLGLNPSLSKMHTARKKDGFGLGVADATENVVENDEEVTPASSLLSAEKNSIDSLNERWNDDAFTSLHGRRDMNPSFVSPSVRVLQHTDKEWQKLGQQISASLEQHCSYSDIFQIPDYYLQEVVGGTKEDVDAKNETPRRDVPNSYTPPTVSFMNQEATGIPFATALSDDTLETSNAKTRTATSVLTTLTDTMCPKPMIINPPAPAARRSSRGLFDTTMMRKSIAEGSLSSTTVFSISTRTNPTTVPVAASILERPVDVTDLTAVASRDDDVEHVIYLGSKPPSLPMR